MNVIVQKYFSNAELNRYYLQHLFDAFSSAGKARFTMSYFYFFGGFSIQDIILNIGVFSISALFWLFFVQRLTEKIGVRQTHFLHIFPKIISKIIVILMLFKIQNGENISYILFFGWMFVHGATCMLKRVSLNAYLSYYGNNNSRGKELAFMQSLTTITAVMSPVLFGALIDQGYIVVIIIISSVLSILSSLCIGLKKDKKVDVQVDLRKVHQAFPKNVKKAILLPRIAYPFMEDVFFIWILLVFDNNFTLVGGFVAFKLVLDLILSNITGYLFDKKNIAPFYKVSIYLTSLFWLLCPLLYTDWFKSMLPENISIISIFIILQATLGLATLVWNEPYNAWYHNAANKHKEPLGFSLYREILILVGMIISVIVAYIFVSFIDSWYWGMLLAVPATLSRLFIIPSKKEL